MKRLGGQSCRVELGMKVLSKAAYQYEEPGVLLTQSVGRLHCCSLSPGSTSAAVLR